MDNEVEIWKDIPNYDEMYQVSSFGKIKSLKRGMERFLKISTNRYGYLTVGLYKFKKKSYTIHQLVAMAFLGYKPDGTHKIVVDHIDNDKKNNHVSNLQLVSNRTNSSKDRKNKTSKYTGVRLINRNNKWGASIRFEGRIYSLGVFNIEEDAHKKYQEALLKINLLSKNEILEYLKSCVRTNSSKYTGVTLNKLKNNWISRVKINTKYKHVGVFSTEEEAYQSILNYKKQLNLN
jgi:hypothetical protein